MNESVRLDSESISIPFKIYRYLSVFIKSNRNAILFFVAIFFGIVAVYVAKKYIKDVVELEKEKLNHTIEMIQVIVAKNDLIAGEIVNINNMALRSVPVEYVPRNFVTVEEFDKYQGLTLSQPLSTGEILLSSSLGGFQGRGFSELVRKGIRAMTILVDEVNSVSGMLQPGDHIDLLFSVMPPILDKKNNFSGNEVTSVFMQNLKVLATGNQIIKGVANELDRQFSAITLEVSPEQAQKLVVAQRMGRLTALLRHPLDKEEIVPKVEDISTLMGLHEQSGLSKPQLIVGGSGVGLDVSSEVNEDLSIVTDKSEFGSINVIKKSSENNHINSKIKKDAQSMVIKNPMGEDSISSSMKDFTIKREHD